MPSASRVTSVSTRMYRHGFGDCFLLSFHSGQQRVLTMLIDGGIKWNTRSESVAVEEVLQDLRTTLTPTGGTHPQLDVLVISHEHWDHLSFFHPTRSPDCFQDFAINEIWLAWTEDPTDAEAVAINSRLRNAAAALQLAASRLREAEQAEIHQMQNLYYGAEVAAARQEFNAVLDDILGFYGMSSDRQVSESGIVYRPDGRISTTTEQALEHILKLGEQSGAAIRYFLPGTMVDSPLLPEGLRIYVAGPPRNEKLNRSDPSRGAAKETYLAFDAAGLAGFIDGILAAGSDTVTETALPETSPFGPGAGLDQAEAREHPFFSNTYFAPEEAYRSIEHSWLDIAGQLALQLDGAVNNTSLVLAIELSESGRVLLFPGDAQVGSWLSWHDYQWQVQEEDGVRTRTAQDLLNNTVLYKVSHHGSHNATLREKGLEMMTHPELVAMIPEQDGSYNGIPYEKLMRRLKQKCRGRVLVSADQHFPPERLLQHRPSGLSTADWQLFRDKLVVQRVYVEYQVDA